MVRLAVVALCAVLALPVAAARAARGPVPLAACVLRSEGVQTAVFQTRLGGERAVRVRAGRENRVTGGPVVGARRQIFKPGLHTVLRVRFRSPARAVRWHLAGRLALAGGRSPSCGAAAPPERVGSTQPAPADNPPAEGPISALAVTADPELQPDFAPGTPDYVSRCGDAGNSVTLHVETPADEPVSVDGQPARTGRFDAGVTVGPGQRFDFQAGGAVYHVRCLPSDFPGFTPTVAGTPQAAYFFVAPSLFGSGSLYSAIFDAHGAPVWWLKAGSAPLDFKLLSDGDVGFFASWNGSPQQFNEVKLDGTYVKATNTVGTPTDSHDYQELPDGDRYLLSYQLRDHVDVSAETGKPEDSDAAVLEAVVQELDPDGNVVWEWNAHDHIRYGETGHWFQDYPPGKTSDGRNIYDVNHINSVEPDGSSGVIVSMRHEDAIYGVDKTSGDITWKLGGVARPESLTVIGDDGNAEFGGQHDARLLPDGTLTLHDNGTGRPRHPRALRFKLDLRARTATLVESIRDPSVFQSVCCGSARRLPGGDWVMSWGANSVVTELSPDGSRPYDLVFAGGISSYRANPVLPGRLDIGTVRAGMDAQYPRP